MTDLGWATVAPLLVGHLSPGVWRADGVGLASSAVAEAASGLGWSVRHGELPTGEDKAAFITSLATLAGTPAYVRGNWDSLADGLTDLDGEGPTLLLIDAPAPTALDALAVEILDEACRFWADADRTVQVVWFGAIPAPSLSEVGPIRAIRDDPAARRGRTPDR